MKIDIALLGWNFPVMTLSCLKAVKEKTHMPYRIIWVDNGSEKKTYKMIKDYVKTFEDYKTFRFEENQYYARGTNKGIELSDSKYVVTLSNDVFVTKRWLMKLIAIMEKHPEIGLISPLTDNIGCNCARASFMVPMHKLLKPDEPYEKINELLSRFVYCSNNVSMFCAVLRRKMIDEIGLLDERLTCWGNDDDYNERVRHSGYKSAVALNCFVSHVHGITKRQVFSPEEKRRIRQEHRQLLKEKKLERARIR